MAGQKNNLRYSEETPWFPGYCIGWIGVGNCGQKTSKDGFFSESAIPFSNL